MTPTIRCLMLVLVINVPHYECFRTSLCQYSQPRISSGRRTYRLSSSSTNDEESGVRLETRLSLSAPFTVFTTLSEKTIATSAKMFLLSAPLGMMLDNYHGLFGVLEYNPIGIPIQFAMNGHLLLKTASWVPFLFGVAGFLMSYIILILDDVFKTKDNIKSPSWPKIFYGISLFSGQYYLSGLMDHELISGIVMNVVLAVVGLVGFLLFDSSLSGLILAIATAIGGPLIEIFLINIPHLYQYTHQDFYGICSWIPWVYFLGAPAVGNLARKIHKDSLNKES